MRSSLPARLATALVVDDDPFLRLLARDALEKIGLQVAEADGGASALAAITAMMPDIILLDVVMPDMSGFEVCRGARQLRGGELIPILMLTSLEDNDSISDAYDAGATDFITKPINWSILGHRVRYMLKAADLLRDVARSDLQLARAQRMTSVGSWEWYVGSDLMVWSEEMYRICGVARGAFQQNHQGFLALVHPADRGLIEKAVADALGAGASYDVEHRLLLADGSERIVHGKAHVCLDPEGKAISLSGTLQDITKRKETEARVYRLANYDMLTSLPNRNLLHDRATQLLAAARCGGHQVAMLFLDLDRFKFINDCFGHQVGDALLTSVASRLQAAVRDCDTVARLGGDEFVLLLPELEDSLTVQRRAQDILDGFGAAFAVGTHELRITASIGVCLSPGDGDNVEALLKNADVAMYSAKEHGRNCVQFYAQDMSSRVEQRVAMEHALREAVECQQFEVYYQPKVSLANGQVRGVEALVRWNRPGHGMVPPDQFIGLAEETGLIVPIGAWVLSTACAQAKAWQEMGFHDLSVAVNLSARQFGQHSLAQQVGDALAATGLSPGCLELELTESVLMSDSGATLAVLRELKALGVTLALDDFGTGYSSLSYLQRFPIDALKIDRSFIADVTTDPDAAMLTKSIILLAHALKLKTVAEGVETEGQLQFLATHNCDAIQGYYFSRPLPSAALADLLLSGAGLALGQQPGAAERTLLLVDDEANVLNSLQRLLRRDGYTILRTTRVEEAFELLAVHKVQVIISDQRMPAMNGTTFLSKVKELYPDTMRIILSGYTELNSVIDSINCGAVYRFFTKPWDDEEIRAQLLAAFDSHGKLYRREPPEE